MTESAVIAKMIASNFEATPNNAPLTYVISHHPPFQCGTVGDLLSLIGKLNRPHEMTAAPLDLDALETAEKAATPGPWYVSPDDGYTIRREHGKCRAVAAVSLVTDEIGIRDSKADAAFIAAFRNAAPALLAAARERDKLREALDAIVEAGTRIETVRVGDMYDLRSGYDDNEITSKEAEIARDALAKARAALGGKP